MARTRAFTTTSRHARGVRPPRSPSCGESYVVKALGWRYGPNAVSSAFTSPDGGGYALGDAQALRRTETANTGSSLATRAGLEWFRWIMGVPPPEDGCAVRWTSGGTELIVIARPTCVTDAPVHVAMGEGGARTRLVSSDTDGSSGGCRDMGLLLQRPHNCTPAIETLDHSRKPLSVGGVPRHSPPVSMFVSGQDESVLPPFDVSGDPVFFGIVGLDRLRPAIQITPLLSR